MAANATTTKWLEELDKKAAILHRKMEFEQKVREDPEYKEAQEKYKAICEGLEERRKIAANEEMEVMNKVMERIAKDMGYSIKETGERGVFGP